MYMVICVKFSDSDSCCFWADELGDFAAELKMSFFQLGISPQIIASIIMQVIAFLHLFHV